MKHLIVGIVTFLFSGGAQAQTAEETFIFIWNGIEAGATDSTGTWSKDGNTYSSTSTKNDGTTRVQKSLIEKLSDCSYQITYNYDSEKPNKPPFVIKYDMSKLPATVPEGRTVSLTLPSGAVCMREGDAEFSCLTTPAKSGLRSDIERLKPAVAYFKSKFCAGSAY